MPNRKASGRMRVLGTALAAALVVVLGVKLVQCVGSAKLGDSVTYGATTIHYTDGATETDAHELGTFLQEIGWAEEAESTVQILKPEGMVVVRFVVQDGAWDDPEVVDAFGAVRILIAQRFFGSLVVLQLCDSSMEERRSIP